MYYPKESPTFKQSLEALRSKQVVVVGHFRPDGDCIGSQFALTQALNNIGINAKMFQQDKIPNNLQFLLNNIQFIDKIDFLNHKIIALDCSDPARFTHHIPLTTEDIFLNIDHHISNTNFAKHNIVIPKAAATCEILAGLFLDCKINITPSIANALYAGILTDTGRFCYESTTSQVFDIAKKLIDLGANPSQVGTALYENEPLRKWKLLEKFLGSLEIMLNGKLCLGIITQKMYQDTGALKEDTEGFVDYARSIQGVEIGAVLEERPDGGVKGSLRAFNSKYRVDLLANLFNGGGHYCAAGLRVDEHLDNFYPKFLEQAKSHIEKVESE